ncbi:MAG: ATP-binding protein [Planctomycetota bacterium]|jgi:predicted AAA+ superfamily ATPase
MATFTGKMARYMAKITGKMAMYRFALENLKDWARQDRRKPIVLRGARQVGKSYLVRLLAQECFESLVEVNFEQRPDMASLFESMEPEKIIPLLELRMGSSIVSGKTLLFLDEIQAAPEVLACLRYFHEKTPGLHVIAAGSLLEFVLEEHRFPMPVGRIEYRHLGPMTFEEFLLAMDRPQLCQFLQAYGVSDSIDPRIHDDLINIVRDYFVVGGMPEAVAEFAMTRSYLVSDRVLSSVLSTYKDDFAKYGTRVNHTHLAKVFAKIPALVGNKTKYTQIDRAEKSRSLKQALLQLENARIVYRVAHSHATGIPLGASVKEEHFKTLFLDVGLMCHACGLSMEDIQSAWEALFINRGAVCEQYVGQHLLYSGPSYQEPRLYCWLRQRGSANAEVDYVCQQGQTIIPIEVKAGKTGTLKSLHMFIHERDCSFAVRFNADLPSFARVKTSVAGMLPKSFRLLSLPFYLIGQVRRLCKEALHRETHTG